MGESPDTGFKGLRLHNTLTRAKEDFVPIDAADVRIYVCGPTVYDDAHIGNARPAIVFDVLYRLLRHLYGAEHVTYVRNITDVDDKIIDRARRDFPDMPLNDAITKVTAETEARFHADVAALGCLEPNVEPRATEHIGEMIDLVRKLIEKNHAYLAEGHVLFDVKSWQNAKGESQYGKLSRRPLDEMIAGARVEVAPYKRDAMDFVLWKPSSAEEPGWESPWGRGRPGWHLECSAMSEKHLGKTFDIHGGGIDLVFPHHENEIAQSRCAHGTDVMANYWLHNGFLQVEGEKMAKSTGNFVTIHELLHTDTFGGRSWSGEVLRLAMLMTHYRQPIDWTVNALSEARNILTGWNIDRDAILAAGELKPHGDLISALCDDLNLPEAFKVMHSIARNASRSEQDRAYLSHNMSFLGIAQTAEKMNAYFDEFLENSNEFWNYVEKYYSRKSRELNEIKEIQRIVGKIDVNKIIENRRAARAEKNWAEADRIREKLDKMGIQLHDAKDPKTGEMVTTWEVKR